MVPTYEACQGFCINNAYARLIPGLCLHVIRGLTVTAVYTVDRLVKYVKILVVSEVGCLTLVYLVVELGI